MRSYIIQKAEDFGRSIEDFHMNVPKMMIHAAFVFHYHITDHSPQIEETYCVWRIVITTDYFEDEDDVDELWFWVVDNLLDLETGQDAELKDWSVMEAIPCTNCMVPDSIFVMEKCLLCHSPICKACHSDSSICSSHSN